MPTTVTTSATVLNDGSAFGIYVKNLGPQQLSLGGQIVAVNSQVTVYTSGSSVTARTLAGTTSVDVTTFAMSGNSVDDGTSYGGAVTGPSGSPAGNSGAAQSFNVSTADWFDTTLTADCTITFGGFTSGDNGLVRRGALVLRQGGVGSFVATVAGTSYLAAASTVVGSFGQQKAVGTIDVVEWVSTDGGQTILIGGAAALGVDLAAPTVSPAMPWVPPMSFSNVANPGQYAHQHCLFVVERRITINKIWCVIGTTGGNMQAGIYALDRSSNTLPGTLLATTGTIATPAASTAGFGTLLNLSAPITLLPGAYTAAAQFDGGTATLGYGDGTVRRLGNIGPAGTFRYQQGSTGSLGLPATSAATAYTSDAIVYAIHPVRA